jgi:hypothetical protein
VLSQDLGPIAAFVVQEWRTWQLTDTDPGNRTQRGHLHQGLRGSESEKGFEDAGTIVTSPQKSIHGPLRMWHKAHNSTILAGDSGYVVMGAIRICRVIHDPIGAAVPKQNLSIAHHCGSCHRIDEVTAFAMSNRNFERRSGQVFVVDAVAIRNFKKDVATNKLSARVPKKDARKELRLGQDLKTIADS